MKLVGLTQREAEERLKAEGRNTLAESRKTGPLRIFAGQFKDVMVMILIVATVISALLGEITDAVTILIIVLLNAVLGFIQEYRTEHTLESLRSMTAPTAKCYRDNALKQIDASELVTDDVIELEAGDRVPADAVIIRAVNLSTDESVLTGESLPVEKKQGNTSDSDNSIGKKNVVYCGTSVLKGVCTARVIATGKNTQMGKISHMLADIESEPTPLQKRLAELGKVVAIICIGVCVVVFLAGVLRGEDVFEMLMTGIAIAIGAIPEGLPATVTIALALAVNRMMKLKALVNKLHSVETLGCASVICSDKTGTITENKMTVTEIFSGESTYYLSGMGYRTGGDISKGEENTPIALSSERSLNELLRCSVMCSTAEINKPSQRSRKKEKNSSQWQITGDPTEVALLIASAKGGVTRASLGDRFRKIREEPFDSETRFMAVFCSTDTNSKMYFKGAPEVILSRCTHFMNGEGALIPLTSESVRKLSAKSEEMSSKALRVLAMAYCVSESFAPHSRELVFLGFTGMYDPPREEAKVAIRKCTSAEVKTVMITGDHKNTAVAVAKKAGLLKGGKAMTGAELDALSDDELDAVIDKYTVFARAEPVHKLRIVRSFRRRGEIVTMTGDGVNDAPAIKEADVGVAMGITGTDVTKQSADVILLDDNLATLVSAVEQGRCVYSNIRKLVRYLLSCNIGEVLTMFLGIVMGMPVVLLPVQLLLVNLVTDGLPAVALGLEPPEDDIMKRPPRKSTDGFFSGGLMTKIVFRGIMIGIASLASFTIALKTGGSVETGRTCALITLVMSQLINVFECKSETKPLYRINPFTNMKLVASVIISLAVLVSAVALPQLQVIFATVTPTNMQILISLLLSVCVSLAGLIFRV